MSSSSASRPGRTRASSPNQTQLQAQAILELRRRQGVDLSRFRLDACAYIREKLGWEPWAGADGEPGQVEIIDAYVLALAQQLERRDFEHGRIAEADLRYWRPGQEIFNWIRVEAGHTVGKTKMASGLVNHFFDCFPPAIAYTFAPSWQQIHDLLWKEIKADRRGKGLPGDIQDMRLEISDDHFATGKATNNAQGTGTERSQGQHGPYLLFVLDEAEGIPEFVFGAVDSMASGGIVIVLVLANPRTRVSKFHKLRSAPRVVNFRLSCLFHPNVLQDREVVPGAVRRDYVAKMVETHCEVVNQHNPDEFTFELPWRPGVIYLPDAEFCFRVLGVAPQESGAKILIGPALFESARKRAAPPDSPAIVRYGVDVARDGDDFGTIYRRWRGSVRRIGRLAKQHGQDYAGIIRDDMLALHAQGATNAHIRVDGGGGYGGTVVDQLEGDLALRAAFTEFRLFEVHFGGTPHDPARWADVATELYGEAAEALKGLRVESPPELLEPDLTERLYEWVHKERVSVKKLHEKAKFKKDHSRSPDDGDGFVLCVVPDHIFKGNEPIIVAPDFGGGESIWRPIR